MMFAEGELKVWEERENLMPWQRSGRLTWTATGYGHIPTTRMVKTEPFGPWRRVWAYCISNSGTCYVKIKGQRHIVPV